MDAENPQQCRRCGGATNFVGRISMPRQVIYIRAPSVVVGRTATLFTRLPD
jgi:hypothetical protein